jgi:hypothetical protein
MKLRRKARRKLDRLWESFDVTDCGWVAMATCSSTPHYLAGRSTGLVKKCSRNSPAGIDVDGLAARLQDEGAKSFVKSWNELLAVIASKSDVVKKAG